MYSDDDVRDAIRGWPNTADEMRNWFCSSRPTTTKINQMLQDLEAHANAGVR